MEIAHTGGAMSIPAVRTAAPCQHHLRCEPCEQREPDDARGDRHPYKKVVRIRRARPDHGGGPFERAYRCLAHTEAVGPPSRKRARCHRSCTVLKPQREASTEERRTGVVEELVPRRNHRPERDQ